MDKFTFLSLREYHRNFLSFCSTSELKLFLVFNWSVDTDRYSTLCRKPCSFDHFCINFFDIMMSRHNWAEFDAKQQSFYLRGHKNSGFLYFWDPEDSWLNRVELKIAQAVAFRFCFSPFLSFFTTVFSFLPCISAAFLSYAPFDGQFLFRYVFHFTNSQLYNNNPKNEKRDMHATQKTDQNLRILKPVWKQVNQLNLKLKPVNS